ncbi:phosphotransferase [Pseudonocardia sp.]|uniref:phosphotransferase n=1 Tax=Pseudonocardia sp. TaxID=60912 RepID=UPI003D1177E2
MSGDLPAGPPDDAWLPALARRAGHPVRVVARTALAGGYHGGVERVDLDGAPPVVVKRARPVEIAALRAVAVVRGVEYPTLLAAGADWVVTDFHDGVPLAEGPDVPDGVWTTLARVHAHWWRRRPRAVPVTDAAWWRHLCRERIRPHLLAAAGRTDDPAYARGAALLDSWAGHAGMHAALAGLPRTLTHGDPHRGNVLLTAAGPVLVDWGNARVAPSGFDLAVLRGQGAVDLGPYRAEFARLAGAPSPEQLAVEECCADAWAHVGYLGFAADHLGVERVGELLDGAARALGGLAALGG